MSQKIRIGNHYWHDGEEMEVVTTHHDETNHIWYRGVKSKDNAGVIATTEWLNQQPYDVFLGAVTMRDYPEDEDWQALREVVLERDDYTCQGCGSNVQGNAPIHHIVPLGCGGTNTRRNLITLCEECHGRIHGGPI